MLLCHFRKEYPKFSFVFICGTDILDSIREWNYGNELCEEFEFIICRRLNYLPAPENYPKKYKILETYIDASSTKIRNRISEHIKSRKKFDLGISGLTTKSVIKYISRNHLYSAPEISTSQDISDNDQEYQCENELDSKKAYSQSFIDHK